MDLKEEEAVGDQIDQHWYYVAKAKLLGAHLGHKQTNHILDVGAGSGWFSKWLLKEGFAQEATCVDLGYDIDRDETVDHRQIHYRKQIANCDADLVLMMDVLEHVDDDTEFLKEYLAKVAPGTMFIITVPAFNFLWSAHDEFLDHKRRYTIHSLLKVVTEAGATPLKKHYYYGMIFPLAVIIRLLRKNTDAHRSDIKPRHPIVNWILLAICSMERRVMRFNTVAGLSVVCVCRR